MTPPASLKQLVWEPVPPYPGVLSLDFSLEARYLSTLPGRRELELHGYPRQWLGRLLAPRRQRPSGTRPPSCSPAADALISATTVTRRAIPIRPCIRRVRRSERAHRRTRDTRARRARPVKDIAVLLSADSMWSGLPLNPPREWMSARLPRCRRSAQGAGRRARPVLHSEQRDAGRRRWRIIKALILPEQCILSARECDAIRSFVDARRRADRHRRARELATPQ